MSTILVPHRVARVQRHTTVPWLWRAVCTCGATFHAGIEDLARAGLQAHIEEEEPFPIDMIPDDPTHGRADR